MARRSPWINDRAQLLVRLLDEKHGMEIDEDCARDDISDHVDIVASRMRIGRQAAKYYVTDEVIEGLADHIATLVNQKRALTTKADPHLRVVRPWERQG